MKFLPPRQYQPRMNRLFQRIAEEVGNRLRDARIEHIGASSIPGAISKGDLDVFVGVPRHRFAPSILILEDMGYSEKKGTLGTQSLRMLETKKYDCDVAIQLVENGSSFEMFLKFRDILRNDAKLLSEYNAMKRSCEGFSEERYRTTKAAFIESVLTSE